MGTCSDDPIALNYRKSRHGLASHSGVLQNGGQAKVCALTPRRLNSVDLWWQWGILSQCIVPHTLLRLPAAQTLKCFDHLYTLTLTHTHILCVYILYILFFFPKKSKKNLSKEKSSNRMETWNKCAWVCVCRDVLILHLHTTISQPCLFSDLLHETDVLSAVQKSYSL